MNMKLLAGLAPQSLKRKIFQSVADQLREKREQDTASLPAYQLAEKHIAHLRMLTDRQRLLEMMPKQAVVAEMGVDKGGFSEQILRTCQPKTLHLLDVWASERYSEDLMNGVKQRFASQLASGQVVINRGYSTEMMEQFEDNYFDWVYIDTDHSYPTTAAELAISSRKVKPGGIIAGHDYSIGNWNGSVKYGVIESVHEFCVTHDWEMIYLTMEADHALSFAIREINSNS
jgi:predicted O-methyltransferase YrrM